jgi:hypothetical protein
MYEALSEVGYVYARIRLQTPECANTLAHFGTLADKGDTEYLMAHTIWDLLEGNTRAQFHMERAARQGNGQAAFALFEYNHAENWLAIAVKLKDEQALAFRAERKVQTATKNAQVNARYVESLVEKYEARISYSSPYSEQAIKDFQIDCHAPDGRVLPLLNVLYAKIKDADSPTVWLVIKVDSRGDDIRIYDIAMGKRGAVFEPQLSFELNKWGELRSISARTQAIMNACYGTYGPIWVTPHGTPRDQ